MKRLLLLFLFIICACGGWASGAGESRDTDLQFAMLIKKGDESWYRKEAEGFKDRCAELGVSAMILDNRMDPNITLMNMDLVIEKKVDAVAIIIPEQKMGPVIVNRAFESDTAIISLDHKLLDHQGRQLAPHLGIDDKAAGYTAGVWIVDRIQALNWYSDGGRIVGIAGLTNKNIQEYSLRVNAAQRALFEWLPNLDEENYYPVECPGSDAVGGLLAMQELLNHHPEISNWIVLAATDDRGIGAVRALEQVGLGEHSIVCGVQAERAFSEFSKDTATAFAGAVYYDPYLLGRRAADSLYKYAAEGSVIPAETSVPFKIISRENFQELCE